MFSEWICLDHEGYAGVAAKQWWAKRFEFIATKNHLRPATVNEALQDMFLTETLASYTKTITVKREGKRHRIIAYNEPLNQTEVTANDSAS